MRSEAIGRPMEIMLVEDSLAHARLTIKTLLKSGLRHRLCWTSDGMDAREFLFQGGKYARAPQPDLILLDLILPNLHGKELLSEIRNTARLRRTPVVIMTAERSEQGADEFAPLDVQGYLNKPLDTEEFLSLVRELKGFWKKGMILPKVNEPATAGDV